MTTLERILDTIEVISTEADYIYEAIKNIDNSVPAKATAFANVVTARENTNQRMVDFVKSFLMLLIGKILMKIFVKMMKTFK